MFSKLLTTYGIILSTYVNILFAIVDYDFLVISLTEKTSVWNFANLKQRGFWVYNFICFIYRKACVKNISNLYIFYYNLMKLNQIISYLSRNIVLEIWGPSLTSKQIIAKWWNCFRKVRVNCKTRCLIDILYRS